MKILLINTPVRFNKWQNLEMPLGIAYIASELERRKYSVAIKDYEVDSFDKDEFTGYLKGLSVELVGISFRSASYASAKTICCLIKKINPAIKIILGGHHASAFSAQTLSDMPADFVIRGEGEYAMSNLAETIAQGGDFAKIAGLTYRLGSKILENAPSENITDLDALNFPAWHLLPMDKYVTGSILTSRGCPFNCIYCDKGISTRQVRFRAVENIYKEIAEFEKKYKKQRIYFVDDYFFLDKKRLKALFELILKDNELKFKWSCQARVDGVDDAGLLADAKKTGCDLIIYGIETGDEDELRYINKRSVLGQAERAIRLTKKAGIRTRANFMIGFPISTKETVANSVRFAKKINADLYRFFIVSPLPNTVLWERVIEEHPEISQVSWDKFDFYTPCFDTKGIKKTELAKYVLAAYFYVLKNKVLYELSIGFIPRMLKLSCLVVKNRRIRGNLSKVFPASVNLFLEVWFIIRHLKPYERMVYLRQMLFIAKAFK
jgi:radical SAM superfamily enzyme YgiQ (UPF0313 family)